MNKFITAAIMPWLFAAIGYKAVAQDVKVQPGPKDKEVQEIIIKNKSGKDATIKIEFKNDQVLINGKSLVEFKDDEITINNKTYKYKVLEKDMVDFSHDMEKFGQEMELAFGGEK